MRKYINKVLIIVVLIFLNLIFIFNNDSPNLDNAEIKKRFSANKDMEDLKLKKPRKIDIVKSEEKSKLESKDEIINKILMNNYTKSSILYEDSDMFSNLNSEELANTDESSNDTYTNSAIVLEDTRNNKIMLDWEPEDASIYHEGEEKVIFLKKTSRTIDLKPKTDMYIKNNFLRIDFEGCDEAILNIENLGKKVSLKINNAMGIKYFYIEEMYRGYKINSIEFLKDDDNDFYLAIGEISNE